MANAIHFGVDGNSLSEFPRDMHVICARFARNSKPRLGIQLPCLDAVDADAVIKTTRLQAANAVSPLPHCN